MVRKLDLLPRLGGEGGSNGCRGRRREREKKSETGQADGQKEEEDKRFLSLFFFLYNKK